MADRTRWRLALGLAACAALGVSAERPLSGSCSPRLVEEPMAFIQTQVEVERSSFDDVGQRLAGMLQEAAEAQMDSGWAGEGISLSEEARDVPKLLSGIQSLDKDFWLTLVIIVESTVLLFTMGIPFLIWLLAYVLGRTIKVAIETFDRLVIGTDVTIKDLRTNVFNGVVTIEGLEVHNPTAGTCKHCKEVYNSKYLLKAGIVHIDIDMAALFCSFFTHFKVEKIEFKNVDVIVEKVRGSSNVQDVIDFLKGISGTAATEDCPRRRSILQRPTQITLHEVSVEDVGARLEAGRRGIRLAVGDIRYADFAKEVGESRVGPIVQVLLKSVLKTVVVNAVGKRIGEYLL